MRIPITCDAHKWFSVPMGAGCFSAGILHAVREAFDADISFMPATHGAVVDPVTIYGAVVPRFIGLKLFLAFARCAAKQATSQ